MKKLESINLEKFQELEKEDLENIKGGAAGGGDCTVNPSDCTNNNTGDANFDLEITTIEFDTK